MDPMVAAAIVIVAVAVRLDPPTTAFAVMTSEGLHPLAV
jgi:hypothetical protein